MVTTTNAEDLGLRANALRIEAGVSAQKLAADTRIPYATLLRRLNGDGLMTVAELKQISTALGVTTASWFEVSA